MMKLLGNYKDWIQQDWIDYCMTNTGQRMPKDYFESGELDHAISDVGERSKWFTEWGIDPSSTFLERFDSNNFPFELKFPFIPEKNIRWTLFKYSPGGYMPLHSDDVVYKNERKLWIPFQNYVEGHMVLHDKEFLTSWQAGDLFYFENPDAKHGFANISGVTRIVMMMVVYPDQ